MSQDTNAYHGDTNLHWYANCSPVSYVDVTGETSTIAEPAPQSLDSFSKLIGQLYDQQKKMQDKDCVKMSIKDFQVGMMALGWQYNLGQVATMWKGCIGYVAAMQQNMNISGDWVAPEDRKGTQCYMPKDKGEAEKRDCKGDRNLVWIKQGKWKSGMPPGVGQDKTIPPDSVVHVDAPGVYNYIPKVGNLYLGTNNGAVGTDDPRYIWLCPSPDPLMEQMEATMWCSTCVKCPKKE
jgi:hypothetical protein